MSSSRSPAFSARWFVALQYLLPHHLISRLVFRASRWRTPFTGLIIRWFARQYDVNIDEAERTEVDSYPSFNAFFTRALRPGARPIEGSEDDWVSPCDGRISQLGGIQSGNLLQAKGRDYTVTELLGGDAGLAKLFDNGRFATIYLSPRDYHRVHMPFAGRLRQMIHVPGRLFSVSPSTVQLVPRIFARNERLVCLFDTEAGPMAMVLVGAINVAAIETIWAGLVTPPAGQDIGRWEYGGDTGMDIALARGQEMGRFNLGSTVILLLPDSVEFNPGWAADQPVQLGQILGHLSRRAADS